MAMRNHESQSATWFGAPGKTQNPTNETRILDCTQKKMSSKCASDLQSIRADAVSFSNKVLIHGHPCDITRTSNAVDEIGNVKVRLWFSDTLTGDNGSIIFSAADTLTLWDSPASLDPANASVNAEASETPDPTEAIESRQASQKGKRGSRRYSRSRHAVSSEDRKHSKCTKKSKLVVRAEALAAQWAEYGRTLPAYVVALCDLDGQGTQVVGTKVLRAIFAEFSRGAPDTALLVVTTSPKHTVVVAHVPPECSTAGAVETAEAVETVETENHAKTADAAIAESALRAREWALASCARSELEQRVVVEDMLTFGECPRDVSRVANRCTLDISLVSDAFPLKMNDEVKVRAFSYLKNECGIDLFNEVDSDEDELLLTFDDLDLDLN